MLIKDKNSSRMDGSVTLVQAGTETLPCMSMDILYSHFESVLPTVSFSNLDLVMVPFFYEHDVGSKCPPLWQLTWTPQLCMVLVPKEM